MVSLSPYAPLLAHMKTIRAPNQQLQPVCNRNWHGIEVLQALSEAATSVVLRCKCSRTGYEFVVKSYSKEYMTKEDCKKAGGATTWDRDKSLFKSNQHLGVCAMTGLHHLAATKMTNEELGIAHAKFTSL